MLNSIFLKADARTRLAGNYLNAVLGSVIYIIPVYLIYLIEYLLIRRSGAGTVASGIIDIIFKIFVVNIFLVGYIRFLMKIKTENELTDTEEKRCDFNLVLSGFSCNFKNTLKVTFLKDLYLFLWGLIALIPLVIYTGIMLFMCTRASAPMFDELYNQMSMFMASPTIDMAENVSLFIDENFHYLPLITMLTFFATILCIVPVIYKSYEYMAIPMILAENPDMEAKSVFKRSFDIMHGFRMRYFFVQLSFIGYLIIASLLMTSSKSIPLYYGAQALLLPYMQMTFIAFYRRRSETVRADIDRYGEATERSNEI